MAAWIRSRNELPRRMFRVHLARVTTDEEAGPRRMRPPPYKLSFTSASLRPELARVVAEHYLHTGNWESAKANILSSNALQTRSARSARILELEFRQRLQTLSDPQLTLLMNAPAHDRAAIAWLAVIKHIAFAYDFAAETLRDKIEAHDPVLRHSDFDRYVESKSVAHPELGRLKESSKKKIRQVLLSMLTEAGLIGTGRTERPIHRPVISPPVMETITGDDPRWLAGFLVPDTEIVPL